MDKNLTFPRVEMITFLGNHYEITFDEKGDIFGINCIDCDGIPLEDTQLYIKVVDYFLTLEAERLEDLEDQEAEELRADSLSPLSANG